MERDRIHPQLLDDCYHLGRLPASAVLLHRNASLPWFILVPDTQLTDLLDLPVQLRNEVLEDCAGVSAFIKEELGIAKVNFAGLGNVVPQMHLHITGRRENDACWPQPVWGNLSVEQPYEREHVLGWQADLQKRIGLQAVNLSV